MSLALTSRRAALMPGQWVRNELWRRARAVPSLDLRFADNKSLTDAVTGQSLITFTRASSGTFVGSDGVLQTAVTNLLLRSEEFNDASWTKVNTTVTANSIAAPNETVTADIITDSNDGAAVVHSVSTANQSLTSGLTYTISVYAKAGTQPGIAFIFPSTVFTSSLNARFNISTGIISSLDSGLTGSITAVGDGWYRCSATATATATASSGFQIRIATASTSFYQGNGTGTISLWGAQLEQSSTVGEYVPTTSTINSAPRFDHAITASRTNFIRNNTNVGAVAGTPGTLPTNWTIQGTGVGTLTQQIVGTGTQNGIDYIDIKYSGTTSTTDLRIAFEPSTQITASLGQSWTTSAYTALVAGSLGNITSVEHSIVERNAAGVFLAESVQAINTSSTLVRGSLTRTLSSATVERINSSVKLAFASGVAIDVTLRIGMPQLEQGSVATSVIPTTTAAVTVNTTESLGLLVEEQRTNNIFPSADFSSANWTKTNIQVSASTTTAPDGSTCFAYEGSSASSLLKRLRYNFTTTTVGAYTYSIYLKAGTEDSCAITIQDNTGSNGGVATILLTNGTVTSGPSNFGANTGTTVSVQALSNGFYRISLTTTFVAALTQLQAIVTWDLNGSSTTTGTIFPWGAQLELGSFPTSYIPTTTATATRSADVASITGTAFSSWYRQDAQTWFGEYAPIYNASATVPANTTHLLQVYNTAASNNNYAIRGAINSTSQGFVARNPTFGAQFLGNSGVGFGVAGLNRKVSYGIDSSTLNFATNGSIGTDTNNVAALMATHDILSIGSGTGGSPPYQLNGTIKRLTYWPTRLANNTLQEVTR